jgi:sulfite reductase (NADPH) hemoprotein beta-component
VKETRAMPAVHLPKILTANDLRDGDVVFLGPDRWVLDCDQALIAFTPEDAARFEAAGAKARSESRIADPYLVEVAVLPDGTPRPLHYREVLRTRGPTVRLDLGKQAASATPTGR